MHIITTIPLLVLATFSSLAVDALSVAGNHSVGLLTAAEWCPKQEYHVDYPGNDIITYQVNIDDCCSLCISTGNCGAFTWTTYEGGSCYLKTKMSTTLWKGVNPDGSANTISTELYRCDPMLKDIDLGGEDLTSFPETRPENCCQPCQNMRLCFGWSWSNYNGGTCWLKGERGLRAKASPGVFSAYK